MKLIMQTMGHISNYFAKSKLLYYLRFKTIPDKTFKDYSKCVFEINLLTLNILCEHVCL